MGKIVQFIDTDAITKDLEAYLRTVTLVESCFGRIVDWNFGEREPEIEIEFQTKTGFERHWYGLRECAEVLADMIRKKAQ